MKRPVLAIGAEAVRALAALALFMLAFAHVPVAPAAAHAVWAQQQAGFCGDQPDDPGGPGPCHACRIGGSADLPQPCGAVSRAFAARVPVRHIAPAPATPQFLRFDRPAAHGPPSA